LLRVLKKLKSTYVRQRGVFCSGYVLCRFQNQRLCSIGLFASVAGISSSAALSMAHGTFARGEKIRTDVRHSGLPWYYGVVFMGATPNITKAVGVWDHSLFIFFWWHY